MQVVRLTAQAPGGGNIYRRSWLVLLPMILVLAGLATAFIVYDRHHTHEATQKQAMKLVSALAEHTRQAMAKISRSLAEVAGQIGPVGPAAGAARVRQRELLNEHQATLGRLVVVDVHGRIVLASRGRPELAPEARLEVVAVAQAAGAGTVGVGPPVTGSDGARYLLVAKRLGQPEGGFSGALVAALPLKPFERFHGALNVGSQGLSGLARQDGLLLARRPAATAGRPVEDLETVLTTIGSDGAAGHRSAVDGIDHLLAYELVPDHGLLAYVGLSRDSAFSGWRMRSLAVGAVAALACGLLFAVTILGDRRVASRIRREHALSEKLARLALASVEMNRLRQLEPLCDRATELARDLIGTRRAAIRLDGDKSAGLPIRRIATDRLTTPDSLVARSPSGAAAAEGNRTAPASGRRLAVPLLASGGQVLGALEVSDKPHDPFDATDEDVLLQLGRLVASQIETIRSTAERDRALDTARAAHLHAEQVIKSIPDAFFVVDDDWKFTFINAFAQSSMGRGDLLGTNIFEAYPAIIGSELHDALLDARETQTARSVECQFPPLDDFCDVRLSPCAAGVSLYARSMRRRREMEVQLLQAQKMEVVGRLTGGVAHDFNNLLTVIVGSQEIILDTAAQDAPERAAAEMAMQAAERAGELTQRLLAFARRQVLEPRSVDVTAQLRGLEGLLRRLVGEAVALQLLPGLGLWRAHVDPTQLETAILNVAANARDAMPEGGTLVIEASNVWIDLASASGDDGLAPGQYVMISLSDTGEGMTPDVARQAFEPFFTTKAVGKGSGLGLSMVYGFARQSGGDVAIRSRRGEGTTIAMYLPRSTSVGEEVGALRPVMASGGDEHILVVEDNVEVRRYIEAVLAHLGYHATAVAEGPAALAQLDSGIRCDLLITDVVLPGGLNGRQVAEEALRRLPTLPVVFISGYAETIVQDDWQAASGRLLTKPFRAWELATRVREAIDRRPPGVGP